ncbi:Methyltransferase domain-containing protein [Streptoalloteichus tenebrarius]|uniref:Methyltransferase domain-containing protein n=1 Tax=Streptoalloteichus tenebrarius (strain ATCC 17920 / DSM 40477 / JCM 4838 / CBS 697.72 / NBRC 16177 / NCIMB 11028 / NRRL B-12390 / A12253. 1 / ISP 5477) TaxID=1933 RepID=A0ABT1HYU9_STRSD|nr:methyltransferase domain-containing protein [Streptoalloteichus tenebrarius]MCP2260671.1 Methyltransferase domain-containing protein [Streptoalloteichus tenebrarius]BFF03798.1 methyltransferase domain-containing protein [Streptoalloteichus tenebrarius]
MTTTAGPTAERYGDHLFHHGHPSEFARLSAMAAALDPGSRAHLTALGVGPGWRCLDLGAGTGSVTRWLSEQVGDGGEIVAVDQDVRFLSGIEEGNVTVVEADVTAPDFAPGRFDLVHARFLLMHLRSREKFLARVVDWLRPGGWLVVSDAADLGTPSSDNAAYRATMAAYWHAVGAALGTDITFARRYPRPLAALGLTNLGVGVHFPVVSAGSGIAECWRLSLEQARHYVLATGSVTAETVDETLRYLATPTTWDLSLAMVTAWGRRT